jgi:tRNA(fMet)-specific endonuclease VapC
VERLILDTSARISLERRDAEQADVLPDDADVAISAVTASELLVGVELADHRYRERRSELVEGAIDRLEIIAFDLEIVRHHASLLAHARRAGQPRAAHDLQIAATARATGRIVITTDATAFEGLPRRQAPASRLIDPYHSAADSGASA